MHGDGTFYSIHECANANFGYMPSSRTARRHILNLGHDMVEGVDGTADGNSPSLI
jgi:hypothetical protein